MNSPTPNSQAVALATIGIVTGDGDQVPEPIPVHFNPVSLQLVVSNELKDTGNAKRKQFIAKTTTKLTMDLVFDTTDCGQDVTLTTRKLEPGKGSSNLTKEWPLLRTPRRSRSVSKAASPGHSMAVGRNTKPS